MRQSCFENGCHRKPPGDGSLWGAVCVTVHIHSLGRGCQHMVQVAVTGRTGEWVREEVSMALCVIVGGAPHWESGGVILQAAA